MYPRANPAHFLCVRHNQVLGDVEESVTTREVDEETEEEMVKVRGSRPSRPDLSCMHTQPQRDSTNSISTTTYVVPHTSFAGHQTQHGDALCAWRCCHPRLAPGAYVEHGAYTNESANSCTCFQAVTYSYHIFWNLEASLIHSTHITTEPQRR